jgi:hypothetical protein
MPIRTTTATSISTREVELVTFIAATGILFISSLILGLWVMELLKKLDLWNQRRIKRRFDKDE